MNLPHEQTIINLREQALNNCLICKLNKTKVRKFMACGKEPPHNYPFHECPQRMEKVCIVCKNTFEVPVIAYLWITKCPDCFKKKGAE